MSPDPQPFPATMDAPQPSEFRLFWQRYRKNPAGLAVIVFVLLLAATADILPIHRPDEQFRTMLLVPPSWHAQGGDWFPLGTDAVGRDMLSRVIFGARLSFSIGLVVVTVSLLAGVSLGLVAAFYGGVVDTAIMRSMDVLLALPSLLLAIVVVACLGPGIVNAMMAVAIVALPAYVRLTRATAQSEMSKEYVVAAKLYGAGPLRLMVLTVLPNCIPPLIVLASLGFSAAILEAAALGFLGLGAQPPLPEWGAMLSDALEFLESAWWVVLFPGMAILVTVLAFNLAGDGLRDALDPKLRT
jgi:dipeptide transport system permease protein